MDSLVILLSFFILVYFEVSAVVSIAFFSAVFLAITFFTQGHFWSLVMGWFLFLTLATFMLSSTLRQRFITNALVVRLQRRMPSISQTERDAIEAGDVWWEKELFSGRPCWKNLLNIPRAELTPEEHHFLDHQTQILCDMLDDWQIVNTLKNMPDEVWRYLKQERFFGMIIPKEYGGLGFSALAHSSIITRIATKSMSAAISVMVPNSLGPAELLLHYGTDEQKSYYLPRLASGEEIPCFALTGTDSGSDAGAMLDSGVVCYGMHQDQKILGVKLNWDKRYITLAPIATVVGIAFRLFDPENLLGKGVAPGVTLCLVPAKHKGVEQGTRHNPLHLGFMNGPTRGKDVFIPIDWIIGGLPRVGEGWRMLMECLSIGRGISLPALSTACGQMTYRMTGAYARLRRQFNVPISTFEGVSEALGYISGYTYMLEACRLLTASAVDQKIRPAIVSAISKHHMTEMARKVIGHAMDVEGGHAIQAGPENFLAHAHMAIPISITVEGANILTRNLIIFGQGAIRCHPYLLKEVDQFTAEPSKERSRQLDKLLFSHAGRVMSLVVRNFWLGFTGGRFLLSPQRGIMARYFRQLTRMSAALALLADVTLIYLGGELKRRERISARLGDILAQLYLASAVLKYFNDHRQHETDVNYIHWCIQRSLFDIQRAIDALLDNYPSQFLGRMLKKLIFPWGQAYKAPSDRLHAAVASNMLEPSALRDRVTHLFHKTNLSDHPSYRIEKALQQIIRVEPLIKKMQLALRHGELDASISFEKQLNQAVRVYIFSNEEAEILRQYNKLYHDVIKVDEFSFDLASVLTWKQSEWKEEVV